MNRSFDITRPQRETASSLGLIFLWDFTPNANFSRFNPPDCFVLNMFYSFTEQRAKNSQILATRASCSLGPRVILRSLGPTFATISKQINLNRVSVSTGCWRNHETVTTSLLFNSHQSNLAFFLSLCHCRTGRWLSDRISERRRGSRGHDVG